MAYLEVVSWYLPRRAEENKENVSRNSRCTGRDSKRAPPQYKSEVVVQLVQWYENKRAQSTVNENKTSPAIYV